MTNAIGGVLGTGLAAFIALRTGSASGYFVPRMLYQLALALVFTVSVLVRARSSGFIVAAALPRRPGWIEHPPVRRTFSEVTLAWALLFASARASTPC